MAEAQATAQASDATATAQAMAMAATATADGLAAQATTQALIIDGTRQSAAIVATASAEQRAAMAEEQLVAAEMARLSIEQQARQAAVERSLMLNRILPWGIGATALGILAVLAAVLWRLITHSRPQKAGDVWLAWDGGRPHVIDVTPRGRIEGPRAQLPATAESLLPDNDSAAVPLPSPQRGHALIAGPTGAGKSTAMRHLLRARENIVVIDPHSTRDDWPGATVIGAGRNFEEIEGYMRSMQSLLSERYEARADGVRDFEPITVGLDEMPAIIASLGRSIEDTWREWLREGRKVGLDLIVSTQSIRVRSLGIQGEGDLLENFALVLALGQTALREYPAQARGMRWPAVAVTPQSGPQPVIIPQAAVVQTNGNGYHAPNNRQWPVILPVPANDPNDITPELRREIIRLGQMGNSISAIQRAAFPSYSTSGGAAFSAIKEILQNAAVLPVATD